MPCINSAISGHIEEIVLKEDCIKGLGKYAKRVGAELQCGLTGINCRYQKKENSIIYCGKKNYILRDNK
jgi:hypothetical protein